MQVSKVPSALATEVASVSKSQLNFRLAHEASKRVENYNSGNRGDVTVVHDPAVLAALAKQPIIGQISVGPHPIVGKTTTIQLGVVKIFNGHLFFQGVTPKHPVVTTFNTGILPVWSVVAG